MDSVFSGQVIEWRGPSPYYFVPVPDEESADIREVAAMAKYGWGVIPVQARLPLKGAVRKPHGLSAGDDVTVEMTVLLRP
ncbi:DUF1905 domain-containing protein [Streptomyces tuirus]|uniref:DUF1905 domain-containing protein n=1 Tax=Streptomyces tuirus TaxID=68278 RepID=A0A941J276_9ACTN|nr:DUF1905 domain-containing protein [Streptomyces tuirus]